MTDRPKPISADALDDDFYADDYLAIETPDVEEYEQDDIDNNEGAQTSVRATLAGSKRKAKKEKLKAKKQKKARQDPFHDIVHIYKSDPATQCAYVHDRQKQALSKLSDIELDEQSLPESQFVDNSKFKQEEHTLDTLPNYIKFAAMRSSKLDKAPADLASPMVIVVAASAIRAANLATALRPIQGAKTKIAKLFAKHMKVEEQVEFLKRQPIHIAVGTPNRLQLLVEQEHVKLDNLELIVIDTEKISKGYNVLESDAVREDLFKLLGIHIAPRIQNKKTKIALF
ncbi:U3-containing 90S pre-ribosomal complex subunit-domain containing protein [Dichotomocladium elegans]|nr:U3-containing 90S pre-ribosomal complex subunit-domain containing protein [Dichotomocladium elegans]